MPYILTLSERGIIMKTFIQIFTLPTYDTTINDETAIFN